MSQPLNIPDARAQLRDAFAPCGTSRWGIEVEWVIHPQDDPTARPGLRQLARFAGLVLPAGGRVTLEPGGQLELSTAPRASMDAALDALRVDTEVLESVLRADGLLAIDAPVDLQRLPLRVLDLPRYRGMEAFFDAGGPAGRWMMCNTASVQFNVSHDPADPEARWVLLNRLAPILLGAFANAPGRDVSGRSWASLRQGIWSGIDPGRTVAPRLDRPAAEAWADYVLAADVMLVRHGDDAVACLPGTPFSQWIRDGLQGRRPGSDDLRYHTTTLFPPVRPRGWLELRVLDALPGPVREVAALVVAACMEPRAAAALARRLPQDAEASLAAARLGLGDPGVAAAADEVFDIAVGNVHAVTRQRDRRAAVAAYADRFVARRLQPWGGRADQRQPSTLVDLGRRGARPALA